jgi:putative ABC transport system permease protein
MRTILTIFAIVIGSVSVTVMLSLVTSAKSFLTTSFEKTGEDRRIIVTPNTGVSYREASYSNWSDGTGTKLTETLVAELEKIAHINSVTPYLSVQNFESLVAGNAELSLKNIQIVGYKPNGTSIREMAAGRPLADSDNSNGIIISTGLADELGYKKAYDSAIGLIITLNPRKDMGITIASITLTIIGIANTDGEKSIEMTSALAETLDPSFERCSGGGPNT